MLHREMQDTCSFNVCTLVFRSALCAYCPGEGGRAYMCTMTFLTGPRPRGLQTKITDLYFHLPIMEKKQNGFLHRISNFTNVVINDTDGMAWQM